MYFLYTLYLNKSIGLKVFNMAVRVGLCLLAYFLVPNYFTVGTLEIVAMMFYCFRFAFLPLRCAALSLFSGCAFFAAASASHADVLLNPAWRIRRSARMCAG